MRLCTSHIVTALLVTAALVVAPADTLWPLVPVSGMFSGEAEADVQSETSEQVAPAPAGAASGGTSGMVTVTVLIRERGVGDVIPIYRFYSPGSGTHFYTPSGEERDMVIQRWPTIWYYEGIAYTVNTAKNAQPLYRFYNHRAGSHFYTASPAERDNVLANMRSTYYYDGETYRVTPAPDSGKATVYRFLNKRNGSHFYTASADERDDVVRRLSHIYQLEGPAFWLGQ